MTRPPRIRLVVLLENLELGEAQRYAGTLLEHIDRAWFAPELWILCGGEDPAPDLRAGGVEVVRLSNGRRVGPLALARLVARLWRCRPDVLYTLAALPNIWGRLLAGLMRIPVVSGNCGLIPQQYERLLYRFSARIITNAADLKDVMTQRFQIEPDRIAVIPDVAEGDRAISEFSIPRIVRRTEKVLREVAQRGTTWTTTEDGSLPPEIPLWPDIVPPARAEKIVERGRFRPDRSLRDVAVATLTVHLPPAERASGAAVVICPGGGYAGLTIDKEGHDVARWLTRLGAAGIVLKYRMPRPDVTGVDTPWPLLDVMRALRLTRDHADEWRIDPQRVGVMGFSAGGHMAAAASIADHGAAFAVLLYPVISMERKLTHNGSRQSLLGARPTPEMTKRYSFENHVTAETRPTLLVHARDDDVVKVDNSIIYADALRRAGVSHELLLYDRGGHGFGLGVRGGEAAEWPERCAGWLSRHGWLEPGR